MRLGRRAGFTGSPQPEGEGPQTEADVLRGLLEHHSRQLLRYVRGYLWHESNAGMLRAGAIEPKAVVDEIVRRALESPKRKPANYDWLLWMFFLARKEVARRRKRLSTENWESVSLEATRVLSEDEDAAGAGYDAENPLDLIERNLEPPVVQARDMMPDARSESPADAAERSDLLAEMRKAANEGSPAERDIFELYYVEGFDPNEIAMILGTTEGRVSELIDSLQQRLRSKVAEEAIA